MSNAESIIESTRELLPILKQRSAKQWQQSRILEETVRDMHERGLFSLLKPRRFGGVECSAKEFFEVLMLLAEADASVAWVAGILNSHDFHLAMFDEQAQKDVWGPGKPALIGSPYAPVGRVEKVDGGYLLSGVFKFSSGCDICEWSLLGGNIPNPEGNTTVGMYGADHAAFLVPRKDYEIRPNWNVHGLKATGSHDLILQGAFVPEHRTLRFSRLIQGDAPGRRLNNSSLYATPFFQILSRVTSTPVSVGVLKGMVQEFMGLLQTRSTVSGANPIKDPAVSLAIAEALVTVDDLQSALRSDFDRMDAWAAAGQLEDPQQSLERRKFRFYTSLGPKRCVEAASELYRVWGGSVINEDLPFGRQLNDLLAIRSHITNNYQLHASTWIGNVMGEKLQGWPV